MEVTMIKSDKDFLLKTSQQMNIRLMKLLDWVMKSQKRLNDAETDKWYLNWKVGYLEKRLKESEISLYADDDADIKNLKNNLNLNGKDGSKHGS